MNASLLELHSRKLAVARQRAMQSMGEFRETVAVLHRAERASHSSFPWEWSEIHSQLRSDEEIQAADYADALEISRTAADADRGVLGRGIEATGIWVSTQRKSVARAREAIDDVKKKCEEQLREAESEVERKAMRSKDVGDIALPERVRLHDYGCLAVILRAISAFFFGAIPIMGCLDMGWIVPVPRLEPLLWCGGIVVVLLSYYLPDLLAIVFWRLGCWRVMATAKEDARKQLLEARERLATVVARAQGELGERMMRLQEMLRTADAAREAAEGAYAMVHAHCIGRGWKFTNTPPP